MRGESLCESDSEVYANVRPVNVAAQRVRR